MGFLYISFVVLGITTVAYLSKLSAKHGVPSFDFTFVLFASASFLGYLFATWKHAGAVSYTGELWLISAIAGAGGATAVFIFNKAVKIGHFGYSNAIYRSSFLIPVILSVLLFNANLNLTTIIGIAAILTSVFLVSWSDDVFTKDRTNGNVKWFIMILCAFMASGLPRIGQLLVSHEGLNSSAYLFTSYIAGFILLFIFFLFRPRRLHQSSLVYGSIAAFASFAGVYFTIASLKLLSAAIVFPITLSAPIMLGMLISIFHKERIRSAGWIGIFLGICGILMLALQVYRK